MNGKEDLMIPALIVIAGAVAAAAYAYEVGGLTGQMMGKLMAGMGTIIAVSGNRGGTYRDFAVLGYLVRDILCHVLTFQR